MMELFQVVMVRIEGGDLTPLRHFGMLAQLDAGNNASGHGSTILRWYVATRWTELRLHACRFVVVPLQGRGVRPSRSCPSLQCTVGAV